MMRHHGRCERHGEDVGYTGDATEPRFARGTGRIERQARHVAPDRLRDRDIAHIVHDFKGPLSTIALEMHLVGENLGADGNPDIRAAVARTIRNVAYLDRMVQDLLDSCAIATGELELRLAPTELRALLVQAIDRLVATRDRGRVVVLAERAATMTIDALRIERVVANLVTNALKFAPRASRVEVRLEVLPDRVRVSVTDAGPGMTRAEAAVVFERTRRTPSARAHEGNGLGLYVSREIVEAHGGTIGVDSVCGVGSRFFFELPAS